MIFNIIFVDNAIHDWKKLVLVSDRFYELYKKASRDNGNEKLKDIDKGI